MKRRLAATIVAVCLLAGMAACAQQGDASEQELSVPEAGDETARATQIMDGDGADITAEVVGLWKKANTIYNVDDTDYFQVDMAEPILMYDNAPAYFLLNDYDTLTDCVFTAAGKAQMEQTILGGTAPLIHKADGAVYRMGPWKTGVYFGESLTGTDVLEVSEEKIVLNMQYAIRLLDESYREGSAVFTIIKVDGRWLVEDYVYPEAQSAQDAWHGVEAETYGLFLSLYEPAVQSLSWYYSDSVEDLLIDMNSGAVDDYYHKVGRFSTIAEMQEATEQLFTKEFCEALLYHAFDGDEDSNRLAMYKEVDGELYRNIQAGGFSWYYEPTDQYQLAYADDQWRILTVNTSVLASESEQWYDFVLENKNGAWKFHHFYDYSPYSEYEDVAGPFLSSAVAAYDWSQISELEPAFLISYYIYEFLSDVGSGYSDAVPYPVPAAEALENLSRKFNGITMEMLLEAAHANIGMEYNEETDTFLFAIIYDPAASLILNVEKNDNTVLLTSIAISKSGRAVRWSYTTAQESGDGVRYLSNQVEAILEA